MPGFDAISDNLKEGSRSTVPFSKQECEDLLRTISQMNRENSHPSIHDIMSSLSG